MEDLWPQAEAARRRLSGYFDPAAGRAAAKHGLNGPGWSLLLRAHLAAPEPVSASRLAGWNPFVNPWTYEAGLQHLAALDLLTAEPDGAYRLTAAGRAALRQILDAICGALCAAAPLPAETLARLAARLQRLVAASLAAPEPPRKTLLRLNYRLETGGPAHPLVGIDRALSDLAAYREDARLAAWQPHMVSGPAWDALGVLWRGTPGSLDEVYGQLVRRGWPRDTYARALQELTRRDWVTGPEPYSLTPQGRLVRERAEAQISRDFLAPWRVLSAEEQRQLKLALRQLSDALAGA